MLIIPSSKVCHRSANQDTTLGTVRAYNSPMYLKYYMRESDQDYIHTKYNTHWMTTYHSGILHF